MSNIKYNIANNIEQAFEKIKTETTVSTYWLINGIWHFRIGGTNAIGISKVIDKKILNKLNELIEN